LNLINRYNGEGLPKSAKVYTRDDADKKTKDNRERNNYYLRCPHHIKPELPWGLDILYRYV